MKPQPDALPAGPVSERNQRLDLLKAVATCLVLVWHLRPLQMAGPMSSNVGALTGFFVEQAYLQVTLVGVPLFYLVSLHILMKRLQANEHGYMRHRARRLAELLVFWLAVQTAMYLGASALRSHALGVPFSQVITGISASSLLLEGGPPLPIVGGSVFYFLVGLLALSVASWILFRADRAVARAGIALALASVSLLWFEALNLSGSGVPHWRADNFLVYLPVAYLSVEVTTERLRRWSGPLLICFLLFSIQDVALRSFGYNPGPYSRASVVFGSTWLFFAVLLSAYGGRHAWVGFLSEFSLGIFATHKYWQLLVTASYRLLSERLDLGRAIQMGPIALDAASAATAVLAASLTLVAVRLGGRTPLSRFLR